MAHGLGAVRRLGLAAFAERFCEAGYACLVFDYRHFGDSAGEPRELLGIPRQQEDWRSAVGFARTVRQADPDRVVLWGTSFAGGHAIVTGADDRRVAAVIVQCPFTDGPASARRIRPRLAVRLAGLAVRDLVAARRGQEPVRVLTAGEPGQVAFMTAPDVLQGYRALVAATGVTMPLLVPARVALQLIRYRPGRRARDVRCPILFVVCDRDSVAPAQAALRHAARAPRGAVRRYDVEHFDIYLGMWFERAVTDEIAFLSAHVPVGVAR